VIVLRDVPKSGDDPLPDTPLFCPACGGPAPRVGGTILIVRSPANEVVRVEVQVFHCLPCNLPLATSEACTTPLREATDAAGPGASGMEGAT
jgi:hypothetical protein